MSFRATSIFLTFFMFDVTSECTDELRSQHYSNLAIRLDHIRKEKLDEVKYKYTYQMYYKEGICF